MPFHITDAELDNAKAAIERHGYSVFFPDAPEWATVDKNWDTIRAFLAKEDLDHYKPREPLRTYAPKSRINLRPVALLHPYDLLIYTALTLILRDDIEAARDPVMKKRVFSHRSKPGLHDALFLPTNAAHKAHRTRQKRRASLGTCSVVAVTDVADFFPRIYHHRLENILKAVARSQRATDAANALMRRLLLNVASRDSYGLPVGPLASSVLAEAILIDVDAALADEGFDFVRWFDDYTFFCRNATDAQRALFFLAEWLHHHHGLTLNPAKTKILAKASFLRGIANNFEQRMKARSEELGALWKLDFYGEPIDLEPEQRAELESLDLASMLREALKRRRSKGGVDYEFAAFILGRLSAESVFTTEQAMMLVEVVIKHIPHLYPIIDSVAAFFVSLEGLSTRQHERVAKALLKPFDKTPAPPDFVAMWILSVFAASSQWNHAQTLRTIYTGATSPIVRRYAALALAANGTRSHALTTRGDLGGAKPLVRTAILAAWHKLGDDERKHWMIADGISDPLEKAT